MIPELPDLYWAVIIGLVLVVTLGMRERIAAWFRRRDQANIAFRTEQMRQARDPMAHFYLTVEEINATMPAPETFERFGRTIWRFEGANFLSQEAADEARRQAVLRDARAFYQDVDRLQLGRR